MYNNCCIRHKTHSSILSLSWIHLNLLFRFLLLQCTRLTRQITVYYTLLLYTTYYCIYFPFSTTFYEWQSQIKANYDYLCAVQTSLCENINKVFELIYVSCLCGVFLVSFHRFSTVYDVE